jgi:type I restriction enzyme S subunit
MTNKDWKKVRLGDVIQFKNGKKRPNPKGQYPVYGGNGILDYADIYNFENVVVVGRVGAYCGNVFFEPNKLWVSDNAIAAINLDTTDTRYNYYLLQHLNLNKRHIGTSQPLLTQEILNRIVINLPPLPIQRRIAAVLSSLDDKIELNRRMNATLEQIAQAIFKNWFVDFEPFKKGKFVESELGMIPKGWKIGTIGEVTKITTGKLDANARVTNGKYRFYTCAKDYYFIDNYAFDTEAILVSGNGAYVGYINYYKGKFNAYQRTYVINNFQIPVTYIKCCLELYLGDRITKQIRGSSTPYIVLDTLTDLKIIIPPNMLLEKFNELTSNLLNQQESNKTQSQTLFQLRDTLLPKLMNGEIEV